MTAKSRLTAADISFLRNLRSFLSRQWPWLLLGLAALLFALRFIPALCLSLIDTETVQLPLFYHDVVTLHHSVSDWKWGGSSDFFPDVILVFLLCYLSQNDWFALQGTMVCFFLGWLVACVGLVFALRRPHPLALVSILFLLMVGEACDFSFPRDMGADIQDPLFQPIYHSGTALLSLAGIVLLSAQLLGGGRAGFYGLLFIVFMAGISDFLFLVVFVVPVVASLGVLAAAFPGNWERYVRLALWVGLFGVAAYFLAPFCIPVPLQTDNYLHPDPERARESLATIWTELCQPGHHFFFFLVVLDVLAVIGGIGGLLFFFFFSAGKKIPAIALWLMVFGSFSIACDWGAVILTGNYQGMQENRYLVVALVLPLFSLAFGLHAIILWRPWLEKLFAVVISCFIAVCAFIPQKPSGDYIGAEETLSYLKDVMAKNHIQAGLISYWQANLFTFLSDGKLPFRSINNDGTINHWFNTLYWYGKDQPFRDGPHFRLIFLPEPKMAEAFGPPDQILHTPANEEIWIYSEARSIRYNEYFDLLSNSFLDDGRTLRMPAAKLPARIGSLQGDSRLAVAGRDAEGYLTYGPYVFLKPARYQVAYRYAYLAPPAPKKAALYDLYVHTGNQMQSLDSAPLLCLDDKPHVFTEVFTVSRPGQTFEMRIYYSGSGTLRVDYLDITCEAP